MISGFVVYCCHGNIDFSKIAIIINFSLNPVSGENQFHVDSTKESVLKSRLKILGMALKKLYRNTLIQMNVQEFSAKVKHSYFLHLDAKSVSICQSIHSTKQ